MDLIRVSAISEFFPRALRQQLTIVIGLTSDRHRNVANFEPKRWTSLNGGRKVHCSLRRLD